MNPLEILGNTESQIGETIVDLRPKGHIGEGRDQLVVTEIGLELAFEHTRSYDYMAQVVNWICMCYSACKQH